MSVENLVSIRNNTGLFKKSKSKEALDIEPDPEYKIHSLEELKPADHIVILVEEKKYCHAILESLNLEKSIIDIIYYDDSEYQCSLDEYFVNGAQCETKTVCARNGVKRNSLKIDLEKLNIFKVDYDITKETILLPNETIEKAKGCIGEEKYNIFANNDEHFAIYCKTGKAAKLFIINPKDVKIKNIIGKDLSDKIVGNLAQQGGQILLVNTAKHIATKFPRSAISAGLPAAAEAAGSVIGVGIEGISMGIDLYKKHQDLKDGKISEMKFKKYVARRVTRGTMGVAGGIAGGVVGQMVIPIPVVGAVVGSLVGGIVGAAVGQLEGLLIGELVEVIENKVKEKKGDSPHSHQITGKNGTELNSDENLDKMKSKFNVLDKLVFKFDKNITKPGSFAHLKDIQIEIKSEANLNESSLVQDSLLHVLHDADRKIIDEDYEIYVLDNTDEIVTNLNVENSLDQNGAIDKRKSLEAFSADQLPENINVFFKILDKN